MVEITRKRVLMKVLRKMQGDLEGMSMHYNGLVPAEGYEFAFLIQQKEMQIIRDIIHDIDANTPIIDVTERVPAPKEGSGKHDHAGTLQVLR